MRGAVIGPGGWRDVNFASAFPSLDCGSPFVRKFLSPTSHCARLFACVVSGPFAMSGEPPWEE